MLRAQRLPRGHTSELEVQSSRGVRDRRSLEGRYVFIVSPLRFVECRVAVGESVQAVIVQHVLRGLDIMWCR